MFKTSSYSSIYGRKWDGKPRGSELVAHVIEGSWFVVTDQYVTVCNRFSGASVLNDLKMKKSFGGWILKLKGNNFAFPADAIVKLSHGGEIYDCVALPGFIEVAIGTQVFSIVGVLGFSKNGKRGLFRIKPDDPMLEGCEVENLKLDGMAYVVPDHYGTQRVIERVYHVSSVVPGALSENEDVNEPMPPEKNFPGLESHYKKERTKVLEGIAGAQATSKVLNLNYIMVDGKQILNLDIQKVVKKKTRLYTEEEIVRIVKGEIISNLVDDEGEGPEPVEEEELVYAPSDPAYSPGEKVIVATMPRYSPDSIE